MSSLKKIKSEKRKSSTILYGELIQYNKENYNLGLSYMDKYSYGITLPAYKNYLIKNERRVVNKIWIIIWTTFLLLLIFNRIDCKKHTHLLTLTLR